MTAIVFIRTFVLFVLTAVAEIVGCYLSYLWLRRVARPGCLLQHPLASFSSPGS